MFPDTVPWSVMFKKVRKKRASEAIKCVRMSTQRIVRSDQRGRRQGGPMASPGFSHTLFCSSQISKIFLFPVVNTGSILIAPPSRKIFCRCSWQPIGPSWQLSGCDGPSVNVWR